MIAESRATHADLASRAPFTKPGERIADTRATLAALTNTPAPEPDGVRHLRSASNLRQAAESGFVEVS
ncbi:MAG: hypothetical protein M3N52_11795 [Actinomycetota bacterium]|nr:hypothetical protein [Actinomycetota bacterium]